MRLLNMDHLSFVDLAHVESAMVNVKCEMLNAYGVSL